jgi:anti-sigma B factor antagonist
LNIRLEHEAGSIALTLSGELDLASVADLRDVFNALKMDYGPVRVDLRPLTFIDSSGLECLLRASRDWKAAGVRFTFSPPTEGVRRKFQMTGLDDMLPIVE